MLVQVDLSKACGIRVIVMVLGVEVVTASCERGLLALQGGGFTCIYLLPSCVRAAGHFFVVHSHPRTLADSGLVRVQG